MYLCVWVRGEGGILLHLYAGIMSSVCTRPQPPTAPAMHTTVANRVGNG